LKYIIHFNTEQFKIYNITTIQVHYWFAMVCTIRSGVCTHQFYVRFCSLDLHLNVISENSLPTLVATLSDIDLIGLYSGALT